MSQMCGMSVTSQPTTHSAISALFHHPRQVIQRCAARFPMNAHLAQTGHTRVGLLNEHASCTNLYLHIFVSSTMHNHGKPTWAASMLLPATLHMAPMGQPAYRDLVTCHSYSGLSRNWDAVPKPGLQAMGIPTQAGQPKSRATSCQRLAGEFALSWTGRWVLVQSKT